MCSCRGKTSFTSTRSICRPTASAPPSSSAPPKNWACKEDVIRKDLGRVFLKLERLQAEQIRKALEPAKPEVQHQRRRPRRSARAAARSEAPRPHPGRLRQMRPGRRRNQQAHWLFSRRVAASGSAAGGGGAIVVCSRQKLAHGCGAGVRAGRRAHPVLGDDGTIALLHGRDGPETQGAGHRGRRRRSRAAYALKLLQSEGALSIASTGKDPGDGQTGHASVSRGRPGDDVSHHHGHRHRRRVAEPLPGAFGE